MGHLLVVDDEQSICWGLSKLGRSLGHSVAVAPSAEEGLAVARERRPDAIVLDVRLPGMDGLTALEHFHAEWECVPVIIVTAYGELTTAVRAVNGGAFDYLVKPFDLQVAERAIQRALDKAVEQQRMAAAGDELLEGAALDSAAVETVGAAAVGPSNETIVGVSPAMQEVFKRIALVAPSNACVHLAGESGTGKELVARAIHRYSERTQGPFVAVNIASLSPALAESELFGHVRGAFTGAEQSHRGLLERAHGGTIFLDEVADIPAALQVKLLRALEHGEVLPVGGDRPVLSDFRLISATHRKLREQVAAGAFRHDLYYRLLTFEIEIPPLRARREDVRPLVAHFLSAFSARGRVRPPDISRAAIDELENRSWYGNVRELRNAVEHALVLARGGGIGPEHLPAPTPPPTAAGSAPAEQIAALIREWGRQEIDARPQVSDLHERLLRLVEPPLFDVVLQHSRGQCAAAARQLGLHRVTLRKKLGK